MLTTGFMNNNLSIESDNEKGYFFNLSQTLVYCLTYQHL